MEKTIFNFHDIILLTTIYQCLLFAFLIFAVKHDRKSDFFLIGFLLTQAAIPFHVLINYGEEFRFIALEFSPNLYKIFETAYWLEGPLLLWYTRSLVYKNYSLNRYDLIYLIPLVIYLIYITTTFYSLSDASKVNFLYSHDTAKASFLHHIIGFARESLRVAFIILCLIEIKRCRQQIRNRYSSIEKIDLGWLNFLVISFLFISSWAVFVSLTIILSVHAKISINFANLGLFGNYVTLGLVTALVYFGIRFSSIFEGMEESLETTEPQAQQKTDPSVIKSIEDYMQTKKPFLANILTLEQLATQMSMPPRTLSNIINRHFERNFFEFINEYRIQEAKHQLADPANKNKTIIDIMDQSGFNSKATFNTFFKKIVGSTPSQYRAKKLS